MSVFHIAFPMRPSSYLNHPIAYDLCFNHVNAHMQEPAIGCGGYSFHHFILYMLRTLQQWPTVCIAHRHHNESRTLMEEDDWYVLQVSQCLQISAILLDILCYQTLLQSNK